MNMLDWAKNEINLACKKEKENCNEDDWKYGVACYENALKAYEVLCNQGHSGMSIKFTQNILNRLIDVKPLTPIEDISNAWQLIYENKKEGYKEYQSIRIPSLFKKNYENGTIKYNDVARIVCVNTDNKNGFGTYHNSFISNLIEEMFPLKMPYYPGKPFKVYCTDFLTDKINGDFDTIGIEYVITPEGEKIEINRYFKSDIIDGKDEDWKEINLENYNKRLKNKITL